MNGVSPLRRLNQPNIWNLEPNGRPNDTAMVIGVIPVGQLLEIDGESLRYEKTLTGSNMGSIRFRADMARYVDFYSPASSTSTR